MSATKAKKATPPLPSPINMWGAVARNGYRVHSLVRYEVYDIETACGQSVVALEGMTYEGEQPDWDADVPCPPKPCPACRKALTTTEEKT